MTVIVVLIGACLLFLLYLRRDHQPHAARGNQRSLFNRYDYIRYHNVANRQITYKGRTYASFIGCYRAECVKKREDMRVPTQYNDLSPEVKDRFAQLSAQEAVRTTNEWMAQPGDEYMIVYDAQLWASVLAMTNTLVDTNDDINSWLITREHSSFILFHAGDDILGDGIDGNGDNLLGIIFMIIREDMRKQQGYTSATYTWFETYLQREGGGPTYNQMMTLVGETQGLTWLIARSVRGRV